MKKLFCFASALLILTACQQKQYFTSSPEIDLVKKANEAYFKGDWETLKSVFADKAKAWFNTSRWKDMALTPDQLIDSFKAGVTNYSEYKMDENPVYEMIVYDGAKWVHCWYTWSGKTKNGKEVSVPAHLSSLIKDNKIVLHFIIVNTLPGYLAMQPSDSTKVTP